MNSSSVQEPHAVVAAFPKGERQLRAAQNQAVDTVALLHPIDDLKQPLRCLRQENAAQQLAQISRVDEILLVHMGCDNCQSSSTENLRIKLPLHRKSCPEQAQSSKPARQRLVASCC